MDTNNDQTQLNSELDELRTRISEMENSWKRALADYKNLEKRAFEEKIEFAGYANKNILMKLLPIVDNLEMVDQHLNDMGLKMTLKEFKNILKEEGLVEFSPADQEFNPTEMDAIDMVDSEDKKNKVIEVLTKGYKLKDKLIRPAKVKVGK